MDVRSTDNNIAMSYLYFYVVIGLCVRNGRKKIDWGSARREANILLDLE